MEYAIRTDNDKPLYFLWLKLAPQRQTFLAWLRKVRKITEAHPKNCVRLLEEIVKTRYAFPVESPVAPPH